MKQKYYYDTPTFNPDKDGSIILIHKYSIAPIESFTYGITKDNQFFLDWKYPVFGDDELENDYRIITSDRLLKALKNEIALCKQAGNTELVEKYEEAIVKIKTVKY